MKKTLSFLTSAVLALGISVPFAEAASFKDVSESYRFYDDIDFLSDAQIISGYPDGRFAPNDQVTRAQAAIMIGRTFDLDGTKRSTSFKDVSSNSVASGYIDSAVEAGIITGFPDGTFRPGQTVTRGQLAILLTRAFDLEETTTIKFKDVSPASKAYPYIGQLLAAGITSGYPDNTYRPNESVTRGQFAAFMSRGIRVSFPIEDLGDFSVDFLNVGQGDAILLTFPNGKTLLVDASRSDAAMKEALSELNVSNIDTFVAADLDADHIGGADYIIKNYNVKNVIDSGQNHTTETYLDYLSAIKTTGASFKVAQEGQNITLDSTVDVTVLHVDNRGSDLNDGSIVLMVSYGDIDYLLTGDAGIEVEKELIAKYDLDAEVLKVSHHGSDTGSSQEFLNAVLPDLAILSYGENNDYGHPNSTVVNRLKAINADIISTVDGTIETSTDGEYVYINQDSPVKPEPKPEPKPTEFANCTELREVYPDGVQKGHPAYDTKHDRDNDGWACER